MALYRSVAAGLLGTVCYVTTDMRNNSRAKDTDNLNPKSSYFSKPIDIQTRYSSHEASLMYLTMANPEITVDDLQQDRAVVAKQMAHKRRNCNFEYAPIVIHTRTTEQPTHPHYKRTTATAPAQQPQPLPQQPLKKTEGHWVVAAQWSNTDIYAARYLARTPSENRGKKSKRRLWVMYGS